MIVGPSSGRAGNIGVLINNRIPIGKKYMVLGEFETAKTDLQFGRTDILT